MFDDVILRGRNGSDNIGKIRFQVRWKGTEDRTGAIANLPHLSIGEPATQIHGKRLLFLLLATTTKRRVTGSISEGVSDDQAVNQILDKQTCASMAAATGAASGVPLPHTTAAPNSQTPGHPSFRR